MDTNVSLAPLPQATPVSGLVYDGSQAALYRIFWRNLLLTLLTLGWFRFWAVTRTRRYMWSHMSFHGDRFEYTGTGGEKLRGFLVAVLILGVLWGINMGVRLAVPAMGLAQLVTSLAYLAAFLLLVLMAPFTAQRYRLARTQWRGIGGGMTGSAPRYAMVALLYGVANILTLFLLSPLRRMRLIRRRVEASSFGATHLSYAGEPGLPFAAFLGSLGLKLVLLIVVVFAVVVPMGMFAQQHGRVGAEAVPPNLSLLLTVAVFVTVRTLSRLADSWYDAATLRRVLDCTRYLDLRLASRITGSALFGLRLGNAAIGLLTLGLGAPIVRQRCARFVERGIVITGALEVARLHADRGPQPRDAEGLLEAFDVGFLY